MLELNKTNSNSCVQVAFKWQLTSWGDSPAACMKAPHSDFPCGAAPSCLNRLRFSVSRNVNKQYLKIRLDQITKKQVATLVPLSESSNKTWVRPYQRTLSLSQKRKNLTHNSLPMYILYNTKFYTLHTFVISFFRRRTSTRIWQNFNICWNSLHKTLSFDKAVSQKGCSVCFLQNCNTNV